MSQQILQVDQAMLETTLDRMDNARDFAQIG